MFSSISRPRFALLHLNLGLGSLLCVYYINRLPCSGAVDERKRRRKWPYLASPVCPHTPTHNALPPTLDNGNLALSSPLQTWGYKIALGLLALGTAVSLVVSSVFDQTSVNCSFIKLSLATQYLSAVHFLPRFRLIHHGVYTGEGSKPGSMFSVANRLPS